MWTPSGIMGSNWWALKPLENHDNIVPRGLRGRKTPSLLDARWIKLRLHWNFLVRDSWLENSRVENFSHSVTSRGLKSLNVNVAQKASQGAPITLSTASMLKV